MIYSSFISQMERTIGYRYCLERLVINWMSNGWWNISGDECNRSDKKDIREWHDLALLSYQCKQQGIKFLFHYTKALKGLNSIQAPRIIAHWYLFLRSFQVEGWLFSDKYWYSLISDERQLMWWYRKQRPRNVTMRVNSLKNKGPKMV